MWSIENLNKRQNYTQEERVNGVTKMNQAYKKSIANTWPYIATLACTENVN